MGGIMTHQSKNALLTAADPLSDPQRTITVIQVVVTAVHYQAIMSILITVAVAPLFTQTVIHQARAASRPAIAIVGKEHLM